MYFIIPISGNELLLTPKQLEKVLAAVEGATRMERNYKGAGKGFYGNELSYEVKFTNFDPSHHVSAPIMTQEGIDKIKVLIAMRNGETEI